MIRINQPLVSLNLDLNPLHNHVVNLALNLLLKSEVNRDLILIRILDVVAGVNIHVLDLVHIRVVEHLGVINLVISPSLNPKQHQKLSLSLVNMMLVLHFLTWMLVRLLLQLLIQLQHLVPMLC